MNQNIKIRISIIRPIAISLMLLCAATMSAHASTITVTNTNDSGTGSLRDALAAAHDGDTIDATGVSGTITTGPLLLFTSVTINGPGADNLTVAGSGSSGVFYVGARITIADLTITNGNAEEGGAVKIDFGATLTITNCTLSGNSAAYSGGILNLGTLTIINSTLNGNSANAGYGGGIGNLGTLTIINSTLSGNSAETGGGIGNFGALTIINSTLNGNSAETGGGIYNDFGTLAIGNTILNAGASGENIFSLGGWIGSFGYNLSNDDASAFLNQSTDQNLTDPKLGPLQDNGGPTFTHELLSGSPAIDAGDPNFTPPPDYDQRGPGFSRVMNGRIDIGAFEVQASLPCPQPQGDWKNNPDAWPVNSLMLGGQTYSKAELLTILRTPIGTGKNADASLILADQLIAANLNIANGADDPAPVPATITDADAVLALYTGKLPYRVKSSSTNGQRMVNDAAVLESYDNGNLTPDCGG